MSTGFQSPDWSRDTNIYEVNLRQYSPEGSFAAFAKEMPRLKDMGVETLWFMPITPISVYKRKGSLGSYYACADYQGVNTEFGNLDEFCGLVRDAHGLGFKVIIDWVANHTGWDHIWTREHPEYYVKDGGGGFTEKNGWEDVIDLDYGNQEMRGALIDAMKFWVEKCDIDGFRCDMAHLVPLDFWKTARAALEPLKNLFWLAECEEISYHEVFDATYTWRWMHKTEELAKGQTNPDGLWELLGQYDAEFPPNVFRAYFTSNHDENSWNGTEYEKYGPGAIPLAVFSCAYNGLPLIYSGQELPNLKRLLFFDKDPIAWKGNCALHDFYKKLLSLRKRNKALRAGDDQVRTLRLHSDKLMQLFGFSRRNGDSEVVVLLNLSAGYLEAGIGGNGLGGIFKDTFSEDHIDLGSLKQVNLEPWGFLVLEK